MTIVHRQFGLREIKPTYWYTTAQINDVGKQWASANPRFRTFCPTEKIGGIGLESFDPRLLQTSPHEIVCPINKGGNHWVSLAIRVCTRPSGGLAVELVYSDSMDSSGQLPHFLQDELTRLFRMFSAVNPDLEWRPHVYERRWMQADGCSCGVYALENAFRFLANDEGRNPGATILRERQLQRMSMPIAITGCSTSVKLDELLRVWLQKGQPIESLTSDELVSFLFEYADRTGDDVSALTEFMKRELLHNLDTPNINFLVYPLHVRMKELDPGRTVKVPTQTSSRVVTPVQPNVPVRGLSKAEVYRWVPDTSLPLMDKKLTRPVSKASEIPLPERIDVHEKVRCLQNTISVFHSDVANQEAQVVEVLAYLYQGHVDRAVQTFTRFYGSSPIPAEELALLTSVAAVSPQENVEWQHLGKTCEIIQSASELLNACKANIKTIDYESGKSMLEAHIQLLNSAIRRGESTLLMKVCYAINDAFSTFLKFLSFGLWTPDYEKINAIKHKIVSQSGMREGFFEIVHEEVALLDACIQAQQQIKKASENLNAIRQDNDELGMEAYFSSSSSFSQ